MSPFEVVYGFKPQSPLDLTPLPPAEIVSLEGEAKAEYIKKLHQKVKENIERRTEQYTRHANKNRKQVVFKEGDWVWLHMRTERFPQKRKDKLAPRGDGPFKVLRKINDNAYQLELPGEFNVSSTFNVTDLELFDAGDDPVLRTKPPEEGGNDEDIKASREQAEPDAEEIVPQVPSGPMTRQRARALGHKFNHLVEHVLKLERSDHEEGGARPEQNGVRPVQKLHGRPQSMAADGLSLGHGPIELLQAQTSSSGVFTITLQ